MGPTKGWSTLLTYDTRILEEIRKTQWVYIYLYICPNIIIRGLCQCSQWVWWGSSGWALQSWGMEKSPVSFYDGFQGGRKVEESFFCCSSFSIFTPWDGMIQQQSHSTWTELLCISPVPSGVMPFFGERRMWCNGTCNTNDTSQKLSIATFVQKYKRNVLAILSMRSKQVII